MVEDQATPIVSLESVSRIYESGRVAALRDVSLSIRRGEFLAVVGPSGSGKSTLLHLAGGLDRPTSGRVLFDGSRPPNAKAWRNIRARRLGFVFQEFNLLATLTALENVELPMFGVIGAADRNKRAGELLKQVGLERRSGHRPAMLSGGERQRVAIARALANAPDLILADEPTGNLDSASSREIVALLEDIRRRGATIVVVTHNETVAAGADRIVRLLDGRKVSDNAGGGGV